MRRPTSLDRLSLAELKNLRVSLHPNGCFGNHSDWCTPLDTPGLAVLKADPDPVRIASEGAQWGRVHAHLLHGTVILSDEADQFCRHALRRGETERFYTLHTFIVEHHVACGVCDLIRKSWRSLKARPFGLPKQSCAASAHHTQRHT